MSMLQAPRSDGGEQWMLARSDGLGQAMQNCDDVRDSTRSALARLRRQSVDLASIAARLHPARIASCDVTRMRRDPAHPAPRCRGLRYPRVSGVERRVRRPAASTFSKPTRGITCGWSRIRCATIPWRVTLDPYAAPGGQFVPIAPLFDTLTATRWSSCTAATRTTAQVERVAAFVPPVFGTLTVVVVWALGRRVFGRRAGAAGGGAACGPAGTLPRSHDARLRRSSRARSAAGADDAAGHRYGRARGHERHRHATGGGCCALQSPWRGLVRICWPGRAARFSSPSSAPGCCWSCCSARSVTTIARSPRACAGVAALVALALVVAFQDHGCTATAARSRPDGARAGSDRWLRCGHPP